MTPTPPNPRAVEALAAALIEHLAQPAAAEKLAVALAEHLHTSASPTLEGALLDAGQAAALLGVPKSWVMAEARAGRIPSVALGHYRRFQRDELLGWVDARAQGPKRAGGRRSSPTRRPRSSPGRRSSSTRSRPTGW